MAVLGALIFISMLDWWTTFMYKLFGDVDRAFGKNSISLSNLPNS